jgi:alcohol dehydrogenase
MIIAHDTIKKGDKVLVLGASSARRHQLRASRQVVGGGSDRLRLSENKIKRLRDLGADHVINYKGNRFFQVGSRQIRQATTQDL